MRTSSNCGCGGLYAATGGTIKCQSCGKPAPGYEQMGPPKDYGNVPTPPPIATMTDDPSLHNTIDLQSQVRVQARMIEDLKARLEVRDKAIADLNQQVTECERRICELMPMTPAEGSNSEEPSGEVVGGVVAGRERG